MAKKTIYHDVILNFGKYKGKSSRSVMESDPGYFLWCVTAGTHNLDSAIAAAVNEWYDANRADGERIIRSAVKWAKEKGIAIENVAPKFDPKRKPGVEDVADSVTSEVSFAKSAVERPAVWGSW